MVKALSFYPGGPGSNLVRDAGFFFQTMLHLLVKFFHIRKMVGSSEMDRMSHKVIKYHSLNHK